MLNAERYNDIDNAINNCYNNAQWAILSKGSNSKFINIIGKRKWSLDINKDTNSHFKLFEMQ
jgi:hypothetical protein